MLKAKVWAWVGGCHSMLPVKCTSSTCQAEGAWAVNSALDISQPPPPPSLTPIYYNVGQTFSPAPSPPLHGLGYSFIILSIPIITLYKLTFSLSIYTKDSFTHRHPHIVTNNIHISSHTSPEPTKPVGCGSGRKGMWRDNSW